MRELAALRSDESPALADAEARFAADRTALRSLAEAGGRTEIVMSLMEAFREPTRYRVTGRDVDHFRLDLLEILHETAGDGAAAAYAELVFIPRLHFLARDRMTARLAELDPGRAASVLAALLEAPESGGRRASLLGLFAARDLPGAREIILRSLENDADPAVRNRAALDAVRYPGPDTIEALFRRLAEDPALFVRANALHGLLALAPDRIRPRLEEFREREQSLRREGAARLAEEIDRQIRIRDGR